MKDKKDEAAQAMYVALKAICDRWSQVPNDCISEEHKAALAAIESWEQASGESPECGPGEPAGLSKSDVIGICRNRGLTMHESSVVWAVCSSEDALSVLAHGFNEVTVQSLADDLRGMDGLMLTGEQQRLLAYHLLSHGYAKRADRANSDVIKLCRSLGLSMDQSGVVWELINQHWNKSIAP